MKCYAVIDTNVLVSALLSGMHDTQPAAVMNAVFNGDVVPVFSAETFAEYSAVLQRPKFKFSAEKVSLFLEELKKIGLFLSIKSTGITLPDMKDVPFYAITLANGPDKTFLVTGNLKHFPVVPFVLSPAEFMKKLNKMEQRESG